MVFSLKTSRGGWNRRRGYHEIFHRLYRGGGGEVKTTLYALRGDQVSAQLSQEKSSRSPHPQARNNDRSLRGS